ncbi:MULTISPECIES: hypothetical protein [unclassified Kitasatospora]|uniref:hypothetical protein n=1 Tax=unclassified Kitasatospora TaxID=2633591 RepID=UPI0034011ED9
MKEFDRERAHGEAEDLSHLKDDVDEKNAEVIDHVRGGGNGRPSSERTEQVKKPSARERP